MGMAYRNGRWIFRVGSLQIEPLIGNPPEDGVDKSRGLFPPRRSRHFNRFIYRRRDGHPIHKEHLVEPQSKDVEDEPLQPLGSYSGYTPDDPINPSPPTQRSENHLGNEGIIHLLKPLMPLKLPLDEDVEGNGFPLHLYQDVQGNAAWVFSLALFQGESAKRQMIKGLIRSSLPAF